MTKLKDDSDFSEYRDRHPGVVGILRFLEYGHLPEGSIRETSKLFAGLARELLNRLGDDPELAVALRKLREAKDCAVGLVATGRNR